ncbi:MAG: hypothetical protein MHPSP_002652, partial [Paramarteilia canceri]
MNLGSTDSGLDMAHSNYQINERYMVIINDTLDSIVNHFINLNIFREFSYKTQFKVIMMTCCLDLQEIAIQKIPNKIIDNNFVRIDSGEIYAKMSVLGKYSIYDKKLGDEYK